MRVLRFACRYDERLCRDFVRNGVDLSRLCTEQRSIDDRTLAEINAENLALIAEEIKKHGKFIDAHGNELHFPAPRVPKRACELRCNRRAE